MPIRRSLSVAALSLAGCLVVACTKPAAVVNDSTSTSGVPDAAAVAPAASRLSDSTSTSGVPQSVVKPANTAPAALVNDSTSTSGVPKAKPRKVPVESLKTRPRRP